MIEKQIVSKHMKEYLMQEYIKTYLPRGSYSKIDLRKTPLGEKIIIHTSRPGLVVGRKGINLSELTTVLKTKYGMENPQIEVAEIEDVNLDPKSVAERIVASFERFGPKRFKPIGYRALQSIMDAGALGAEVVISGRGVPSSRAKSWRFLAGHMKKSGDISENFVKRATTVANLKSGTIGIKVNILTSDVVMPDKITIREMPKISVEEVKELKEEKKEEPEKKKEKKVRKTRKKTENETDGIKAEE